MQIILICGYVVVDWDGHSKHIRDGLRTSLRNMKLAIRAAEAAEKEAEEASAKNGVLLTSGNGAVPTETSRLLVDV